MKNRILITIITSSIITLQSTPGSRKEIQKIEKKSTQTQPKQNLYKPAPEKTPWQTSPENLPSQTQQSTELQHVQTIAADLALEPSQNGINLFETTITNTPIVQKQDLTATKPITHASKMVDTPAEKNIKQSSQAENKPLSSTQIKDTPAQKAPVKQTTLTNETQLPYTLDPISHIITLSSPVKPNYKITYKPDATFMINGAKTHMLARIDKFGAFKIESYPQEIFEKMTQEKNNSFVQSWNTPSSGLIQEYNQPSGIKIIETRTSNGQFLTGQIHIHPDGKIQLYTTPASARHAISGPQAMKVLKLRFDTIIKNNQLMITDYQTIKNPIIRSLDQITGDYIIKQDLVLNQQPTFRITINNGPTFTTIRNPNTPDLVTMTYQNKQGSIKDIVQQGLLITFNKQTTIDVQPMRATLTSKNPNEQAQAFDTLISQCIKAEHNNLLDNSMFTNPEYTVWKQRMLEHTSTIDTAWLTHVTQELLSLDCVQAQHNKLAESNLTRAKVLEEKNIKQTVGNLTEDGHIKATDKGATEEQDHKIILPHNIRMQTSTQSAAVILRLPNNQSAAFQPDKGFMITTTTKQLIMDPATGNITQPQFFNHTLSLATKTTNPQRITVDAKTGNTTIISSEQSGKPAFKVTQTLQGTVEFYAAHNGMFDNKPNSSMSIDNTGTITIQQLKQRQGVAYQNFTQSNAYMTIDLQGNITHSPISQANKIIKT